MGLISVDEYALPLGMTSRNSIHRDNSSMSVSADRFVTDESSNPRLNSALTMMSENTNIRAIRVQSSTVSFTTVESSSIRQIIRNPITIGIASVIIPPMNLPKRT